MKELTLTLSLSKGEGGRWYGFSMLPDPSFRPCGGMDMAGPFSYSLPLARAGLAPARPR